MMKVGFTGTRKALTRAQAAEVAGVFMPPGPTQIHHGDCIGADATAHAIAVAYGLRVVVHPPSDPKLRAWCPAPVVLAEEDYLDRNRKIVDATDWLLACPDSDKYGPGSGTWYTIRYARSIGKNVVIVFPNGRIQEDHHDLA